VTGEVIRFVLPLPQLQTLDEMLPGRVVVHRSEALLLALRAVEAGHAVLVLPLPFERYEVRARDQGWLDREAARL